MTLGDGRKESETETLGMREAEGSEMDPSS
jgi:hypothetical protein